MLSSRKTPPIYSKSRGTPPGSLEVALKAPPIIIFHTRAFLARAECERKSRPSIANLAFSLLLCSRPKNGAPGSRSWSGQAEGVGRLDVVTAGTVCVEADDTRRGSTYPYVCLLGVAAALAERQGVGPFSGFWVPGGLEGRAFGVAALAGQGDHLYGGHRLEAQEPTIRPPVGP